MIHLFHLRDDRLAHIPVEAPEQLLQEQVLWIDAVAPSEQERAWLKEWQGIDASTAEEETDIETSARYFENADGSLSLRSDFLLTRAQDYENVPVRFVLKHDLLVSLHDDDLPTIRLLRLRARSGQGIPRDPAGLLVTLYSLDVEYSADALESVYAELGEVSDRVLAERRGTDEDAAENITRIARQEGVNGAIRRNLMDNRRALSFLMREQRLKKTESDLIKQILRDIESLDGHTAFIFDKINFLMDAIMGFININQNKVVKIFSVAAVALLPPTLIASIYGMNFEHMPELAWKWGYPMSLGLMLVSVILPFLFFRRKGWLK